MNANIIMLLIAVIAYFLIVVSSRIIIGIKIDKIFKQKRNWIYLSLMIFTFTYIFSAFEGIASIIFYFFIHYIFF